MVPPLVSFLATHPAVKSQHLASVVAVTGGAAPFGPALIEKFKEKCAPNDIKFREGIVLGPFGACLGRFGCFYLLGCDTDGATGKVLMRKVLNL